MPASSSPEDRRRHRDAPTPLRIVLLDQDPWCRALAVGALRARDYRVVCTGNIETAARVARELAPDLVVADVGIPVIERVPAGQRRSTDRAPEQHFPQVSPGYAILRPLELEPSGAGRPVVLLKHEPSSDDPAPSARFSVLDYVSKPFTPHSLVRHIETHAGRLRARAQAASKILEPPDGANPPAALEGSVEALGVASILEIIHFNQLSGVCSFEGPGARRAEVQFYAGEVIDAHTDEGVRGADAVFRLVTWTEGRFAFRTRSFDVEPRKLHRFEHMMMEGMRRLDENRSFPFEMLMDRGPRLGRSQ
jgi:DNA-binding response OmpR family regulator